MAKDDKVAWKFRENIEPIATQDFWHDLVYGGYIDLEKILSDKEQIQQIKDAVALIMNFKEAIQDEGLLDYY